MSIFFGLPTEGCPEFSSWARVHSGIGRHCCVGELPPPILPTLVNSVLRDGCTNHIVYSTGQKARNEMRVSPEFSDPTKFLAMGKLCVLPRIIRNTNFLR